MSDTMKALVLHGPGKFAIEDIPKPLCPPKGLLLRVIACGLCGSDLRILQSGHRRIRYPWTIGHEICGEVAEVGSAYEGPYRAGVKLAVAPMTYCGHCEFCVAGRYELCDDSREIGQNWPGGFAAFMVIPEESLRLGTIQRVPAGLAPAIAAIAEPAASCLHAQEEGGVGLGDTVVVIGAGPIGCIHVSLALARGADTVIIADISDTRLQLARRFGAHHTVNASASDLVKAVMEQTCGRGADVVITANPIPHTQVQAVEMSKKGARILLFGGLPKDDCRPGIDMNLVHYRGLHLIGVTTFAPRHHQMALTMMQSGRLPGEKLVTHTLPLHRFAEAVTLTSKGEALKVVITP